MPNREGLRKSSEGAKLFDLIITPGWQVQPWYPRLCVRCPILLPIFPNLLTYPSGNPNPENKTLRLVAWLVSGKVWKQREFPRGLQALSQVREGEVRHLIKNRLGEIGFAGEMREIDPIECDLSHVLEFLASLFDEGLE